MDDQIDGLDGVVARLRALPEVNADAKARVLIAVAAERERDRLAAIRRTAANRRIRWAGSLALIPAALVTAVYLRTRPETTTAATPPLRMDSGVAQLANRDAASL